MERVGSSDGAAEGCEDKVGSSEGTEDGNCELVGSSEGAAEGGSGNIDVVVVDVVVLVVVVVVVVVVAARGQCVRKEQNGVQCYPTAGSKEHLLVVVAAVAKKTSETSTGL